MLHPSGDEAAIRTAWGERLAGVGALAPYEPTQGLLWVVIVAQCAGCDRTRWVTRPYYVDLRLRPELTECVLNRGVEATACQACGSMVCAPKFVWLSEGDPAPDPLGALATIVRVHATLTLYCPPTGTKHSYELERVYEVRFRELEDLVCAGRPEARLTGTQFASVGFAYDLPTLRGLMGQVQATDEMPLEMRRLVEGFAGKLERREASFSQIESHIRGMRERIPPEWTAAHVVGLLPDLPRIALVASLLMDACAARNGASPVLRATLATEVAKAYLALGEPGLAERALAEAETRTAALAPSDAAELLETLAAVHVEILAKVDRYDAALAHHDKLCIAPVLTDDSIISRGSRHQMQAYLAFLLFRNRRYDEAFALFEQETAALEELAEVARNGASDRDEMLARLLTHALSGALANWAGMLIQVADAFGGTSEARIAHLCEGLTRAELEQLGRALLLEGDVSELQTAFKAAVPETTRALITRMERTMVQYQTRSGEDFADAEQMGRHMRTTARSMLERALSLSQGIEAWTYVSRQSLRLGYLLSSEGDVTSATALMHQAVAMAARSNDHESAIGALIFLAREAIAAGDGVAALVHVRSAAREHVREIVGQGHWSSNDSVPDMLIYLALASAKHGAFCADAIVVAESLKAISLSVSIDRGVGFLGNEPSTHPAGRFRELLRARERASVAGADRDALTALDREIEDLRRDAYCRDPRYGMWCDATSLDVSDTAQVVREIGERNLTYVGQFATQRGITVYALWGDGAIVEELGWPTIEWSAEVEPQDCEAPHLCLEDGIGSKVPDKAKLRAWSGVLLEPLARRLKALHPTDTIVFSSDPSLAELPLAALHFEDRKLCELARLTRVQGLGVLEACWYLPEPRIDSVLCVGNPTLNLPGAEREAHIVSDSFEAAGCPSAVLTRERATVAALVHDVRNVNVLHFACHTSSDDAAPALCLHPVLPGDNGCLSSMRILQELVLDPGAFVNLCACTSAAQRDVTGPTADGLVPAFLMKGAGTVLSCLWEIDDVAAVKFSERFYSHLLATRDPIRSLAATQRECISGTLGVDMVAMAAWAPFVIFGAMPG